MYSIIMYVAGVTYRCPAAVKDVSRSGDIISKPRVGRKRRVTGSRLRAEEERSLGSFIHKSCELYTVYMCIL